MPDIIRAIRCKPLHYLAEYKEYPSTSLMQYETKYAKSGDIYIAYQVIGDGPFDLIYVPGWVSHVELAWEEPLLARFLTRLSSFARLITFDKRGTGLSDRVPADKLPTLGQRMDDLKAVMEAAGSESAALVGFSEGAIMCALFAATYPERTHALITFGGFAKRIWSPDYPWAPTMEQREQDYKMIVEEWGNEMDIAHYVPSKADDKDFVQRLATYFRRAASPTAAVTLLKMNTQVDIRKILPSIYVPTLVMHRTGDRDVNVEEGRWMASQIPNAEFLELPGEDHMPWVGDQDSVLDAIEKFLTGRTSTRDFDRAVSTILFTDIVGSTELAVELGDAKWRDTLTRHHDMVRDKIFEFRGQEVDTTGDGFVVAFDGPSRGVKCALAIVDGAKELGLRVRCGLHTGDVRKVGVQYTGVTLHIAARIVDQAAPDEVYVSRSVRDLSAGAHLNYEYMGSYELKGIPTMHDLYRVGSHSL